MEGVINLRGTVVPVVDMRKKFKMETRQYDAYTVIIIVEVKERLIGMIVDSVSDVVTIPISSIQSTPHFTVKIQTEFIDGIGQIDNNLIIILNVELILTEEDIENVDAIMNHLKEHIKLEDLEYIILTHYHFDHVLGVPKLKEITKAKIMIHEMDVNFLNFKPDKSLKDNEILNLGDYKLKVIHTPGHTPGSICLYEQKSKILFSGDTVFAYGNIGRTDLPGGSIEELRESIKKLSKINVKILYPGHGEIAYKEVNEQINQIY